MVVDALVVVLLVVVEALLVVVDALVVVLLVVVEALLVVVEALVVVESLTSWWSYARL